MGKIAIGRHEFQTGEWRDSPYSRISLSRARKEYRCEKCGAVISPGDPVFRIKEVDIGGWSVRVVCPKHINLEDLRRLQEYAPWGRTR